MIVVAIIGIIAGIAIPSYMKSRAEARLAACKQNLKTIATAIETCKIRHPELVEGDHSATYVLSINEDCVLYQAYLCGVPATFHIALGTDIIHQHPSVDFSAIGKTSGIDFHRYCYSVAHMDRGVFLNFGSSVIGPEVFLKAISISRNLGFDTRHITTANFDLVDLGDYRVKIGYDDPHYYYRPRKNIVNRPPQNGGIGWHFIGDHKQTIPNLYRKLEPFFGEFEAKKL